MRVLLLVAAVLSAAWTSTHAQSVKDPVESEIAFWSAEIRRHQPGTGDEAANGLAQWPWRRLRVVLGRLFDRKVVDVPLLLRATAVYGDIALFIPREQRPIYPEMYSGDGRVTLAKDGRPVGQTWRDSHLRVAHEIVRRAVRSRDSSDADKALAAEWYIAVASVLSGTHDLAGLKDHLEEAQDRFPRNARIQFLSGCLAEAIASPAVQAALDEVDDKRPNQRKPADTLRERALARGPNLGLAQLHYETALELDPRHDEARARLGRILTIDGKAARALAVLESAAEPSDPVVRYYHHLFLARAYERTSRSADARASYEAASQIFPDAQSPWLALSALAAAAGDSPRARSALERVERAESLDDPWWVYDECSGREATLIYGRFVQALRGAGAPHAEGLPR